MDFSLQSVFVFGTYHGVESAAIGRFSFEVLLQCDQVHFLIPAYKVLRTKEPRDGEAYD